MSLPIIVIDGFIFWPKLTGSPCGTIYFDGYARYTQRRIWTDGDTTKQLQGLLHARLRQYFDGRLWRLQGAASSFTKCRGAQSTPT
jgi:hypothetical protein